MSWENVEINREKLMDVKGVLQLSADFSPIIQNQMFDVDMHGFPVFTDKNIALLNMLFDNDVAYAKVTESSYEEEMKLIFEGMFDSTSREAQ